MKVSFDFDKTLDRSDIQEVAKQHILDGDDVWIITRRYYDEFEDVYKVGDSLGISRDKILFTNGILKWATLKFMDIEEHYDDKDVELMLIDKYTNTKGIKV